MVEKNNGVSLFMTVFVAVLLGVILIGVVASVNNSNTSKSVASAESHNLATSCYTAGNIVNESNPACNITVTYAPVSYLQQDCPLSSVSVTNNTGTALILNTDYHLFASTGVVQMLNTVNTNHTNLGDNAKVTYTYCGANWVDSSWGRDVLNVVVGLLVIAVLIIVVILVNKQFEFL
jgi:uncharacterized membrane protein